MDTSTRIDGNMERRPARGLLQYARLLDATSCNAILSCAAIALLFGTPYALLNPSFGPRRTAAYAVIAIGCLVGALAAERIPSTICNALISAKARAAALLLCALISLPEWIAFTVPAMPLIDATTHSTIPRIAQSAALLALGGITTVQLCLGGKRGNNAAEKRSEAKPAPLTAVSLCWMSFGICFRMLWIALATGDDGALAAYGHVGLAAPTIAVFIAAGTMLLCDETRPDQRSAFPLTIASFSCGVILWNILTRAVPAHDVVQSSWLPAICTAVILLLGAGAALARRSPSSQENTLQREERSFSVDIAEHLKDLSLTQREQEIAAAALSGATSAELAHLFGISASTVRNHLARVYRKANVSSIRELRNALGVEDQKSLFAGTATHSATPADHNMPQGNTFVSHGLRVLLSALQPLVSTAAVMLAGTLELPHGTVLDWGYGRPVALAGAAAGVTLAPLLMSVFPRTRTLLRRIAQLLVTPACVAYLASFPGQSWEDALALRTPDRCLAIFTISTAVFASLPALICREHGAEPSEERSAHAYAGAAAVVLAIAFSNMPAHLLRAASATAVAVLPPVSLAVELLLSRSQNAVSAARACGALDTAATDTRSVTFAPSSSPTAILVFGIVLGFSFEEIWRAAGSGSLEAVLVPGLAATDIILAVLTAMQSNGKQRLVTLAPPLAVSFVVGASYFEKLFLAGLILFVNMLAALDERRNRNTGGLAPVPLAFSSGVLIGDIGVNLYGDLLTDLIRSATYDGAQPLRLAAAGAIGAACAIVAFALFRGSHLQIHGSRSTATTPADEKRLTAYLAYRGLSDTQIDVLLRIARGMTGPEIAEELHIARGTVNSARAAGYAVLKVHSQRQLRDRLISLLEA